MTDSPTRIDVDSPIPMYVQVSGILRAHIAAGDWPHGSRIPTEMELCSTYHVSRITIRQAVALLVRDGLLTRARGRGTFVREPNLVAVPRAVTSFSEELAGSGMKPGSRIIEATLRPADEQEAADMNIPAGTPVVALHRVRTADARPIGVQHTVVVADRVPGLIDILRDDMSLYDVLWNVFGISASGATEVFHAAAIGRDSADLLGCKVGQPGFHVMRVTFDDKGVFERTASIMHGERYEIKIALQKARRTKGMA